METIVSIGNQGFDRLREEGSFYIDKTYFIKEWWFTIIRSGGTFLR